MSDRRRIFVVEDEQNIAHTLKVIFEKNGFTAETFSDAETALAQIAIAAPDLVVTDVILLGKMTGLELTERIAYEHPQVRVVLMSGQARTSELLDGYRKRGLNPSVKEKPIAPEALLKEVRSLLARY